MFYNTVGVLLIVFKYNINNVDRIKQSANDVVYYENSNFGLVLDLL